jgi:hypothetical protein
MSFSISTMGKHDYARLPSKNDDEEKNEYAHPTHIPRSNSRFSRSPLFYLLDLGLVVALAFLFIRRNHDVKLEHLDLQDDITGYAPKIGHQLVTFKEAKHFISNHTSLASLAEAREYWKTLVPRKPAPTAIRSIPFEH